MYEAGKILDPERRKELYAEAIERTTGEAYWIPLYAWPVGYAYSDEVNFTPYFDENPRLYSVGWK
jgi:peptide/nickel transport system substrate-binding protein